MATGPGSKVVPDAGREGGASGWYQMHQVSKHTACCTRRPNGALSRRQTAVTFTLSLISLVVAIVLTSLAASVDKHIANTATVSAPTLWWTGIGPTLMGCVGVYATWSRTLNSVFRWGVSSAAVVVAQVCLMAALGLFQADSYSVWPLMEHYRGHPMCISMVDWCYCQDDVNGHHANEDPDTQYIHMDIRWKDSGFRHCEDVRHVSKLYFATMAVFGVYVIMALLVCAATAKMSLVRDVSFHRLDVDWEREDDVAPPSGVTLVDKQDGGATESLRVT